MPQPRVVQVAASSHVDDWGDADDRIRRAVARLFGGGGRRGAARVVVSTVRAAAGRLEQAAAAWASDELAGIYRLGVQVTAEASGLGLPASAVDDAVAGLAADHVDDVGSVASGLRRGAAGFRVPDGLPVLSPAEVAGLSPAELADLLEHPIGLVRYADGSLRTVADHGDMLTRTRAALAYNQAAVDVAVANGVGWLEVFDGPDCQWVTHTEGGLANGTVRSVEECAARPLAHPRCQRSFRPRPDVTSARRAGKAVPLGLPFDDVANPLPLPGPVIVARPRVQRARASRAVRSRRALRRR